MLKLRQTKGFTLIELVMVILILGILAASAIPKFVDLTSQAEKAAMMGVVGAARAGIGILRAENLAAGFINAGASGGTPSNLAGGWPATLGAATTGDATITQPLFEYVISQGGVTENWTMTQANADTITSSSSFNVVTGVTPVANQTFYPMHFDSIFAYHNDGTFAGAIQTK